jgi:hypothetical protein
MLKGPSPLSAFVRNSKTVTIVFIGLVEKAILTVNKRIL